MFNIPNELAAAVTYAYIKARRPVAYMLRAPLLLRVIDAGVPGDPGYFAAHIYDQVIEFSRHFVTVKMPDYEDLSFVLVHEICHQMMRHPKKLGHWAKKGEVTGLDRDGVMQTRPFVNQIAQWAHDLQVNDFAVRLGLKLPEGALLEPHTGGWRDIDDDIYIKLYQKFESDPNSVPNVRSDVQPDSDKPQRIDAENSRQRALENALGPEHGKLPGMSSADLTALLDRVAVKTIKWWELIRPRYKAHFGHAVQDWTRGCKQAAAMGYFLPAKVARTAGTLCWVIDISGSIAVDDISRFVAYNQSAAETCKPKWLLILLVDTKVREVHDFKSWRAAVGLCNDLRSGKVTIKAGGGTDMRAATQWLKDKDIHPDMTLFLTDGYTPFPVDLGTSKEVYWLINNDRVKAPVWAGKTYVL